MNYFEINEQAARILDEAIMRTVNKSIKEHGADDAGKTIDELIKTSWGGSNESQAKAIQLLKGLAFSDDPRSNQFMKKLDGFTSKMSAPKTEMAEAKYPVKTIKDSYQDYPEFSYRGVKFIKRDKPPRGVYGHIRLTSHDGPRQPFANNNWFGNRVEVIEAIDKKLDEMGKASFQLEMQVGRYDSNRGFNPIQFVNDADTAADRMKDITRGLHDPNVLRVIGSMSKVMDALSDQSKRTSAASLRDLVSLVNELAANSVLE